MQQFANTQKLKAFAQSKYLKAAQPAVHGFLPISN
jgi:hypothetical protein